jgi:hypothetical protein
VKNTEQQFPAAKLERVVKVQEVTSKAAAGKLKWWKAAGIPGVAERTMRRWRPLPPRESPFLPHDARQAAAFGSLPSGPAAQ